MPTPDARIETPDGRCSLWWTRTLRHERHRVGLIGEVDGPGVLDAACERLRGEGCTLAVGPMDGSTWHKYRLVTDPGTEPPFLLEPWNDEAEVRAWREAGFEPLRTYTSSLGPLERVDPRAAEIEAALVKQGYAFRTVRMAEWEEELRRIHPLLVASFARNFLYAPLPVDEFVALYRPLAALVRPETVLLATKDGACVGLFFTYPTSRDTLVFKTIAVDPEHDGQGLGTVLAARTAGAAIDAGFRRGIHALMEDANRSRRISAHYGEPMRRYALFGRTL